MIPTERPLINILQLLRIVGVLLVIEAVFLTVPTATCLYFGEEDWIPFATATILTALLGFVLIYCIHPRVTSMAKRDGFLLTALVWIIFSLFGMMPFLSCSTPLSVTDAFFEAMSGFTTTGATIYNTEQMMNMSHGVMLWRAMTQWLGGMGIILFTLAVVPMLNHSGGIQMFNAEVTGITHEKIRPRISQTALSLWSVYLCLSLILIVLLSLGPMSIFESICHAFGTISTGGFTTDPSGMVYRTSDYSMWIIALFMFLGGVNFALMFKTLSGDFKALKHNDVFRTYVYVIVIFFVLFVISIINAGCFHSIREITIEPLFQIISVITSTGYVADRISNWGPFVLALVLLMMFTGACAGSTSGGSKIDRMLFLLKHCSNEIYRSIYPNSVRSVRINGNLIKPEIGNKVIAFLCLYGLLTAVGGLILTALGVPLINSFFSSFSCISNTGIGVGILGIGGSYAALPDAAKWTLSLLMLIGRLEIFTILLLFSRTFWTK